MSNTENSSIAGQHAAPGGMPHRRPQQGEPAAGRHAAGNDEVRGRHFDEHARPAARQSAEQRPYVPRHASGQEHASSERVRRPEAQQRRLDTPQRQLDRPQRRTDGHQRRPENVTRRPEPHTAKSQTAVKTAHDGKKKRRRMNTKERIMTVVIIAAAVFLIVVMFLNMKIIPAVQYDQFGREIPVRISLMDKFRNWTPFIDVDGELESKDYSIEQKSEIEGVTNGRIFDGLELDQIQEGQFTVLFLGTDESRSNTDVMMLAMFDIRGNQIHILQIPRDTFVPGYTTFEAYKINSVYTLGDQGKKPVQRVVDCLESIFKIPIDRYVTTSCTDIVEIVDLIGGIPIDMPYKITYEADKIIEEGKQTLNGQQAEWMVRFRHDYSEGDIGRMKAQRIFMAAAMEKVCDIGTLELMSYVDTIIDKKLIGSNLTVDEIGKLSDFATSIGMDRISMYMLPGEGYNYYPPMPSSGIEFYSVWTMHKQPIIRLLNDHFRPYLVEEHDLPIPELVTEGNYRSTLYDEDSANFEDIGNGEGFDGS